MEPKTPASTLDRVDYDRVQNANYARARALSPSAIGRYMAAFAAHLPQRRPLTVIDLGSGTGRFTPALADAFGGSVYGVEPAARMRQVAEAEARHPQVRYLAGEAAAIPLPDACADLVLMFLSFHHAPDRVAAAAEIARVLKPGGRFILRSTFKERIPDHWWRGFFPRSHEIEEAMFPTTDEAKAIFEAAGFATVEVVLPVIPFDGDIGEAVERLRLRAVSTFEHMTEQELDEGFARLDAALAAGAIERKATYGDFIVFARGGTAQEPAIA